MAIEKDVVKAGSAGLNLLLTAAVIFGIAAVSFAGWNYSKRKAAEKGKLA